MRVCVCVCARARYSKTNVCVKYASQTKHYNIYAYIIRTIICVCRY